MIRLSERQLDLAYWQQYLNTRDVADELFGQPILQQAEVRKELAEALAQVFQMDSEPQLAAYIQSQWAILARLVHYTDFLTRMQMPDEELQHIVSKQLVLTALYKTVIAKYLEIYGKQPTIPQNVRRAPGFIRFLREQCGLQFVMHYIGFSLRAHMKEKMGEQHPLFNNEQFFRESMSYLTEMVIDFEQHAEIVDTMQKQQDEIVWLSEEVTFKRSELAAEPQNERLQEELQQLEEEFTVEKLEFEFMQEIVEPLF